ncbi:MAG TPA: hypothetical protein VFA41_02240 [Ktedonobacteraceae bacterium]|nr:hypothetical protein [Ktedonobacteraceae bacterium]
MKRVLLYFVLPPLIFIVAFAIVVAVYLNTHKPVEIDLTSKGFTITSVSINEGESIHFVNQTNAPQVLCLGVEEEKMCAVHAVAPAVLKNPGVRLQPGQSVDVLFDQFGTFVVTGPTLPGNNLRVTVNAAG